METPSDDTRSTGSRRISTESNEGGTVLPLEHGPPPVRAHGDTSPCRKYNKARFCYEHRECAQARAKEHGIDAEQEHYEMVKNLLSLEPQIQDDEVLAGAAFRVKCPVAKVIPSAKCLMQASYRDLQNYAKAQDPRIRANSRKEVMRNELIERRTSLLIRYIIERDSWRRKHSDHQRKIPDAAKKCKTVPDDKMSIINGESSVNVSGGLKHPTKCEDLPIMSESGADLAHRRLDDAELLNSLLFVISKDEETTRTSSPKSCGIVLPTALHGQLQEFDAPPASKDSVSDVKGIFPEGLRKDGDSGRAESRTQPQDCDSSGLSSIELRRANTVAGGITTAAGSIRLTKASKQISNTCIQDDPTPVGTLPEVRAHQSLDSANGSRSHSHNFNNHTASHDNNEPRPSRPGTCVETRPCSAQQMDRQLTEYNNNERVEADVVLAELRKLDMEYSIIHIGVVLCQCTFSLWCITVMLCIYTTA